MCRILSSCCLFIALAIAAPAFAQPAPGGGGYDAAALIQKPAVSGFETEVRDVLRAALPKGLQSRVDEAGNLIVTIGTGKPHVVICADMDEDGFFVSGITDDGYLRLHRVTTGVTNRLFEQVHYGQPIFVTTRAGERV